MHLNSQSLRLGTGQKVDFLKAEPEVGVNGSKPSFVVSPRQVPVEGEADTLMNDDPTVQPNTDMTGTATTGWVGIVMLLVTFAAT